MYQSGACSTLEIQQCVNWHHNTSDSSKFYHCKWFVCNITKKCFALCITNVVDIESRNLRLLEIMNVRKLKLTPN
jgi:hypothetical protein